MGYFICFKDKSVPNETFIMSTIVATHFWPHGQNRFHGLTRPIQFISLNPRNWNYMVANIHTSALHSTLEDPEDAFLEDCTPDSHRDIPE